jgi:hypothetical protein
MKFLGTLLSDPFDLLFLFGSAAIVYGAHRIYAPMAWIVGGAIAVRAAWLASARRRGPDQ